MPMDNKKTAVTIIKNRFDKFEIYKRENIIGGKISADPRSGCLKINNIGIKVIIITFVITFKESLIDPISERARILDTMIREPIFAISDGWNKK